MVCKWNLSADFELCFILDFRFIVCKMSTSNIMFYFKGTALFVLCVVSHTCVFLISNKLKQSHCIYTHFRTAIPAFSTMLLRYEIIKENVKMLPTVLHLLLRLRQLG